MEKQTINALKSIYKFNQECKRPDGSCLLDQGYNDAKESAYSIEEMLEGFNVSVFEPLNLQPPGTYQSAKSLARDILSKGLSTSSHASIADVDRLDKHLDSIVYNFGSIYKLGLSPQQALKALSIVCETNLQKLNAGQDSEGKQKKPLDFVPPEYRLQKILDERE